MQTHDLSMRDGLVNLSMRDGLVNLFSNMASFCAATHSCQRHLRALSVNALKLVHMCLSSAAKSSRPPPQHHRSTGRYCCTRREAPSPRDGGRGIPCGTLCRRTMPCGTAVRQGFFRGCSRGLCGTSDCACRSHCSCHIVCVRASERERECVCGCV